MKRLLIANRGEIAIRIARTASEMGIETVGLAPEDDLTSLHTSRADQVVTLPGKGARAYLDIDAVVAAAREANIDAVHPGYGFLSENADFADAIGAADVVFVGPTSETLRQFGDKSAARQLALDCDVPVLDGLEGPINEADAKAFLESRGQGGAIMLKAMSGGGGRGMRVVRSVDDLPEAFARSQSEAQASFGDDRLYLEEYLTEAKHIEVQILGDGTGKVTHLGERECSLQRKHQKIIEIAPSINLDADVRMPMLSAAVQMAEAVSYRGVGTIEFLMNSETGRWAFIEGNARLQVEHTVTEEVFGVDLVRTQLEIARGRKLSQIGLSQRSIRQPRGFAVQCRINMERMQKDGSVRPAGGTLTTYQRPSGPGIRVDDYGRQGYKTSPHYDSLLAKVVAHSSTSDVSDALHRADRALSEFEIDGVPTNKAFLQALLRDEAVRSGEATTEFIDANAERLLAEIDASSPEVVAEKSATPGAKLASSDPLAVLDHGRGGLAATAAETVIRERVDEDLPDGVLAIPAPMQGGVVSYAVSEGDEVWAGRTVAIMEAMKMEHEIKATESGVVERFGADEGDTVFEGHPLVYLQAQEIDASDHDDTGEIDLDHVRADLMEALERINAGHDENRPEAVKKRHARGHRTARENIADLCDEGSFVEYGSVVVAPQRKRRTMEDLIANTTGDGMVCGLGHVNGHLFGDEQSRVMAMTYDYMVLAGTQGGMNHYKKDRMFEIAEKYRLPTVLFAEGGGGRPGDTDVSGVAGLDCLAFNYFAKLSGLAPTVGIVNGRCFAGNAVLLGCCDVIIATEGTNIGIGGPAMIEGGGLGVFKPEDVGPMDVQVPNGVVDIAVKDEAEAVAVAKQYLSYFQGPVSDWEAPDERELRFVVPENRLRWYDMRNVINGIADIGSVLELRKEWGVGIITSLIRVEGRPMGVIANNPSHLSGAIDAPGADKGSRFMQLCDAFDIPILSLIDCPGIMVGPEIEKTALVRHACRMMVVGANIDTPFMSVVIRKGYGLGAQAMAGGSFKAPMFCVTWPTGEFGGMGLEGAVKLGFRKELQAIEDPEERIAVYEDMVAKSYERGKAVNMASHFEVDDVIDPANTRRHILAALRAVPSKPIRTGKKRPNIDTW